MNGVLGMVQLLLMTDLDRDSREAEQLRSIGFAACLHKPVRQAHLRDTLVDVLGRRPAPVIPFNAEIEVAEWARGARVLLAEDNEINQKVAVSALNRLGIAVDTVGDGRLAVDAVRRRKYDLVLMDVHMPVMDGFEATAEIRKIRAGAQAIPVIAMTANAMAGDRERCLAAGMDDYIAKPVDLTGLCRTLERWLQPAAGPPEVPCHPNPPERRSI